MGKGKLKDGFLALDTFKATVRRPGQAGGDGVYGAGRWDGLG